MTAPPERGPGSRPPRLVVLLAAAIFLVAAGWVMTHLYTSRASRQCAELYQSARTAADTARADSTVPSGRDRCMEIRTRAGWPWPASDSAHAAP